MPHCPKNIIKGQSPQALPGYPGSVAIICPLCLILNSPMLILGASVLKLSTNFPTCQMAHLKVGFLYQACHYYFTPSSSFCCFKWGHPKKHSLGPPVARLSPIPQFSQLLFLSTLTFPCSLTSFTSMSQLSSLALPILDQLGFAMYFVFAMYFGHISLAYFCPLPHFCPPAPCTSNTLQLPVL